MCLTYSDIISAQLSGHVHPRIVIEKRSLVYLVDLTESYCSSQDLVLSVKGCIESRQSGSSLAKH